MKQTLRAFKYWRHWVSLPKDVIAHAHDCWSHDFDNVGSEGLLWYNGWWDSFWYVLNTPWLEISDKMTARTNEWRAYFPPYQSL
jgi:hypothetical protein